MPQNTQFQDLVFVTSPVTVIGREQSANLSRHSVILQQKTLAGGCSKRSFHGKVRETEKAVRLKKKKKKEERVEKMEGVQQDPDVEYGLERRRKGSACVMEEMNGVR